MCAEPWSGRRRALGRSEYVLGASWVCLPGAMKIRAEWGVDSMVVGRATASLHVAARVLRKQRAHSMPGAAHWLGRPSRKQRLQEPCAAARSRCPAASVTRATRQRVNVRWPAPSRRPPAKTSVDTDFCFLAAAVVSRVLSLRTRGPEADPRLLHWRGRCGEQTMQKRPGVRMVVPVVVPGAGAMAEM